MKYLSKFMSKHGMNKKEEEPIKKMSDEEELEYGEHEESEEHGLSEEEGEKIASDHLEKDKDYYEKEEFMKKYPKALQHFMEAIRCVEEYK